jgi:hypothetical protein
MADEKARNKEQIKLRRDETLRELALASFHPRTHTGIVSHRKHIDRASQVATGWAWPTTSVNPDDVEYGSPADRRRASVLRAISVVKPRKTPSGR